MIVRDDILFTQKEWISEQLNKLFEYDLLKNISHQNKLNRTFILKINVWYTFVNCYMFGS